MLAVTLVMAVAFLALARRERGSVTTTTDTTTARLAAETALANAEAQIVAGMLSGNGGAGSSNAFNLRLIVSTNYINPAGFDPASANPTNVNYGYLNTGGPFTTPDQRNQNIANLFFLPRAPVFIFTNQLAYDFRYYLDLNENGIYDAFGMVPQIGFNGGFLHPDGTEDNNPVNVLTNMAPGGDPEWVGVLEHPDAPHGVNNQFLSRYAFIALPVGNTLDVNYLHNQTMTKTVNQLPSYQLPLGVGDGYFRNQGVGSWEINLAAFLADLNTNQWGAVVGSGAGSPFGAANYYEYNEPVNNNFGTAFQDARALLSYRYDWNYYTLSTANAFFNNNAINTFPYDGIDDYSQGPLQTNLDFNEDNPPVFNTGQPWAGANNPNKFFAISDFFDPTKVGGGLGGFTNHLQNASSAVDTYDRYTFYRMLDELGTDSAPDEGKLNLNYSNAVVTYAVINGVNVVTNIAVIAGAETNLVPWRPQDFFHAAGDQLIRYYSASWFRANPYSYLSTYYGITNYPFPITISDLGVVNGLTNAPFFGVTNQVPAFGITNIPVLVNGSYVYTPAVNRLLQLAANLYDATTNGPIDPVKGPLNLPHVFRPIFGHDNFLTNIFIIGYLPVTFVSGTNDNQLYTPYAIEQLANNASSFASGSYVPMIGARGPVNVYGVPWIIGAKKGLPGFNQLYMISAAQVTRKLQVTRTTTDPATATYATNQMYDMSISNRVGVSFWNSYSSAYRDPVNIFASDTVYLSLTNSVLPLGVTNFTVYTPTAFNWPGSQWSGSPFSTTPNTASFVTANWSFNYLNDSVLSFTANSPLGINSTGQWDTSPLLPQLPQVGLLVTNYLQAYILDGNNVIDYVQLRDPITSANLNQVLADPDFPNPNKPGYYYQWSTNAYQLPAADPTYGVINQINVSKGVDPAPGNSWVRPPGMPNSLNSPTVGQAEQTFFNGLWIPNFYFGGINYNVTQLAIQAPYTPIRTAFSAYLLQANDPLVHYLASDLNAQIGTSAKWNGSTWPNGVWKQVDNSPLPVPPTTPIGGRYQPWGQNKQMAALSNVDTNAFNLAYKDSITWDPDNWDFPTNLYPSVGWIGRVHRGSPWQTVDLKSTNILLFAAPLNNGTPGFQNIGTNTWANWTGDIQQDQFGQFFDAANSAPMQDRFLFDLFTTRFSDNAVRGTLPVNQTHLAAWSALFSGMVVVSNSTAFPFASLSARPTYVATNINPAGVDLVNSPLWQIVNGINGINATRINASLFPLQSFTHVGDVLQAPALTEQSPFLNTNSIQRQYGISDELYEWLPQQMMGLVRLGEPRYVVYCYGQTLHPAPGGQVLSGPFFQMITNYQVVAESVVRAVIRVDNANTSQPHAVVESYNVLPPN